MGFMDELKKLAKPYAEDEDDFDDFDDGLEDAAPAPPTARPPVCKTWLPTKATATQAAAAAAHRFQNFVINKFSKK